MVCHGIKVTKNKEDGGERVTVKLKFQILKKKNRPHQDFASLARTCYFIFLPYFYKPNLNHQD
jgi:hypothetical protein